MNEEEDDEDDLKDFIEGDLPDEVYGKIKVNKMFKFCVLDDYYESELRKRKYKK